MVGIQTLRHWHCRCGYHNAGVRRCSGCHRSAPRWVRINTRIWLAQQKARQSTRDLLSRPR
jgi:hypothetical protein